MAIGTSGGDDQGAPLEARFSVVAEVGNIVLRSAEMRSNLRISGRTPSLPFLDRSRFSQEYVEGLQPPKKITSSSVEAATRSSLGLSVEAGLQVLGSRPQRQDVAEDMESLHDIERMLSRCEAFVGNAREKDPITLSAVTAEIARKNNITGLQDEKALNSWASETVSKARARIRKGIQILEDYDRG